MLNRIKDVIKRNRAYLTLFAMLPMLTGCSMTDYVFHGTNFIKNPMGLINNLVTNACLGFLQAFNSMFVSCMMFVKNIATNSYSMVNDFLSQLNSFSSIINIVSFLAVCAIIARFAYSVFKENLSDADNRYASDIFTRFKKVAVAAVCAFAVPYCVITGFLASSAAGVMVTKAVMNSEDMVAFQVYDAMEKSGVSFATYCSKGQEAAGAKDLSKLYGFEDDQSGAGGSNGNGRSIGVLTPTSRAYTPDGSSAYNYYCRGASGGNIGEGDALNVWQAFLNSDNAKGVISVGGKSVGDNIGGAGFAIIGSILVFFGACALFVVGGFSIMKRLIDVIMLIAMSWWYIGGSISDLDNKSIGSLVQNALKIMLTQFIFCFEIGIFVAVILPMTDMVMKGLTLIAATLTLAGTPTMVEQLVVDTGAMGDMTAAGSAARNGVRKFFGR